MTDEKVTPEQCFKKAADLLEGKEPFCLELARAWLELGETLARVRMTHRG